MKFRFTIARFLLITFLLLIPVFFSCTKSGTDPPPAPELKLSLAEEPGLTDIRLKLEMKNVEFPQTFTLVRDGLPIAVDTATTNATTITDTALSPSTTYRYRAYRLQNGAREDSSALFETRTMDTTSHNFQWELIEFPSPYGSGVLRDVAIIDDNNIWAVGEIYSDSVQPWLAYNAVHWDGQQWELKRIQFRYFCDQPSTFPAPAKSVLVFGNDDVFISAGSQIAHWNGQNQDGLECLPVSVNKLWGTDKNNIYAVGSLGKIAYYDGQGWQRIESGTDLNIYDIGGCWNDQTSKFEILCAGSKHLQDPNFQRVILKIQNGILTELSSSPIRWTLYSTWFVSGTKYYVAGGGLYEKHHLSDDRWRQIHNIAQYYTYRIRGININDVVAVGGFGEIVHFNGVTWKNYIDQTRVSGNYYSVDIKDDLTVAVGYHGRPAVIAMGKRH